MLPVVPVSDSVPDPTSVVPLSLKVDALMKA